MLTAHHGQTLCSIQASHVSCGEKDLTMLLLLPELIIVVDCKENVQQQAFALSQIDCLKYEESNGRVCLQILLTGQDRTHAMVLYTINYYVCCVIRFWAMCLVS